MQYAAINGELVNMAAAVVPVTDHGFLYGLGLFETFRTYQGVPYLLERHLERMASGCKELGIPFTTTAAEVTGGLQRLMDANGLRDAYVRYTVSAGEAPLGLPSGDYSKPNHILLAKALPDPSPSLYESGKMIQRLSTPRNTPEGEVRFKSAHYMNSILAKRELNGYGQRCAGCRRATINPGWSYSGRDRQQCVLGTGKCSLHASISTGILPGITRAVVMEIASQRRNPLHRNVSFLGGSPASR